MPELVAIAYQDETAADRAVEELCRCREELLIDPDASSVLVCERDGACQLTISYQAGATAHWSRFWGALLDSLLSSRGPATVAGPFRNQLLALLRPGTSMLLLAVPAGGKQRALDALSHFEGQALSQRLADDPPGRWSVRDPGLDR